MTVVPMNSFSNAAAEKVTDFLALNGGGRGELLYFVCGDAALEPYYEALVAVDAPRPALPRLREEIDRMIRHLEEACHPGKKYNSMLLWYGARLNELRYYL